MRIVAVSCFALAVLCAGCTADGSGGPVRPPAPEAGRAAPPPPNAVVLTGAGATFPYPLYAAWIDAYAAARPNVRIDYEAVGSGEGINRTLSKSVDFGASDAPMTDDQLAKASGAIIHIPTVLGAVVVTYNLDGVPSGLKLDGETIAAINLGSITSWDDERIRALNPDTPLPAAPIAVVSRLDGSGTTAIFTDYLSKISPEWKQKVGAGVGVHWPVGITGRGNDGVAAGVLRTPGAIGYLELAHAEKYKLAYASVRNAVGQFVAPSLDSVTEAAAGVAATLPDDLRTSITNAPGKGAYPISGFTYLLVYREQPDAAKGKALADFVSWALDQGAAQARKLNYAPLPPEVLAKTKAKLGTLDLRGQPAAR
jgi:phosphate transport system substrate-binding protein